MTDFAGINRTTSSTSLVGEPVVLTMDLLRDAAQKIIDQPPQQYIEIHHPECPKILTRGEKACRCSCAPWEGVFEDELERGGRSG